MILRSIIHTGIALLWLGHSQAQESNVLFDNTHMEEDRIFKIWPSPGDEFEAQQFFTGESDNIATVTVGLNRIGSPGGELIIEVWSTDESTGNPGEHLAEFGRIKLNDLRQVSENSLPDFPDLIPTQGSVTDLSPNTHYYLVTQQSDEVRLTSNDSYVWSFQNPSTDAGLGDLQDALVIDRGKWVKISELVGQTPGKKLFVRIEAAAAPSSPTIVVEVIGKGSVTVSPKKSTYEFGEQVTLTAVPTEGHALVGWDGDWLGQEDAVTLTIERDLNITAEFGEIIDVGSHRYAFGEPKISSAASDNLEDSPMIAGDGLTMYLAQLVPTDPDLPYSIHAATRLTTTAPWGTPNDLMNGITGPIGGYADHPSITDDGLSLFYISALNTRQGPVESSMQMAVVRRASTTEAFDFSKAVLVGEAINSKKPVTNGTVLRDGSGILFTSWPKGIWFSAWDAASESFGEAKLLLANGKATAPDMSPDGLTLVLQINTPQPDIYLMARQSTASDWSAPVALASINSSAWEARPAMSPDLTRLYFGSDRAGSTPSAQGLPPFSYDIYEAKMRRLALPDKKVLTFDLPAQGGSVEISNPGLDGSYPVGTELTITAMPAEGFRFVEWSGQVTGSENPLTFVIEADTLVTPVFAKVVEPPIDVDIAPAVAISWDSQAGKTYQIHSSTDLENWTLAIDAIQGTGERLTQCFEQPVEKTFYRIEAQR